MVADIGPARMAGWVALIVPAINQLEREAMEREADAA